MDTFPPPGPVVCLMGPTATGKTDLALALADRLPVGIISVDSAMVYRHFDIGTGKPSPEVLARHPHRLVDIRDPWEQYSAGDFASDAAAAIRETQAAGRIPLLVGGTLLYFRSLIHGLSDLPAADAAVRAAIDAEAARHGWAAMHARLAAVDPVAAARIGPADRQRIQRALEVWRLTGQPISALQGHRNGVGDNRHLMICIIPGDRRALAERIERRFSHMMAMGFPAEVERILALPGMDAGRPALRAVGYRQMAAHLMGNRSRTEAVVQAVAATRQLAKRQLTWLRREQCDLWLEMGAADIAGVVERAISKAVLRMQTESRADRMPSRRHQ